MDYCRYAIYNLKDKVSKTFFKDARYQKVTRFYSLLLYIQQDYVVIHTRAYTTQNKNIVLILT